MAESDTPLILQKLDHLTDAVNRLVDKLNAQPIAGGRNGQAWAIATFTTVILALVAVGYRDSSHSRELMAMQAAHQSERVLELDAKLQKEIEASADLFEQAEKDSAHRHETQQVEIQEIKNWFKAPRLRNDHGAE